MSHAAPSRTCVVYCNAATNGASTSASSQTRRDLQSAKAATWPVRIHSNRQGGVVCLPSDMLMCRLAAVFTSAETAVCLHTLLNHRSACKSCSSPVRLHTLAHYCRHNTTHLSKACGSLEARLSTPTSRCCTYIGAAAMERAPLAYSARQSAKWGPLQCVGQHVGGVRSVRQHRAQQRWLQQQQGNDSRRGCVMGRATHAHTSSSNSSSSSSSSRAPAHWFS